ncbi:MAG: pyridoxamine 5'-phosphate oxidase family protein [Filifactor alocis]|nr:pyridoxamine 5'-phosphate oxidase family protein [Filifactor alocis]
MRRKDKEVTDIDKINEIIDSCDCCRLGFYDRGSVYIVPLNFGHLYEDGRHVFYFHGAKQGRKIDLIKEAPSVGFELDTNCRILENELACEFSASYQSIIGTGRVSFVQEMQEKKQALVRIMQHNSQKKEWEFSDKMAASVCVYKLEVEELCCKQSPAIEDR